ncbi:MAG: CBS domain-containing protein [Rhodocyclaceae bacterium]|nr:CBS domain-containing protein [Rhodocyclaceae bacterium]MCP5238933.1 CBS domain-containing protein [Zoogloeaceae bacterium]MCB1912389.1 CBS domain-containing protein [Rhodocyclaceae bacterium]MCP5254179.1 CBS domain-containing protein [Zoogloeaceae bacterium]MCP5295353.1 CBS domain-containing protein [Zoogloeaceae bacterium]
MLQSLVVKDYMTRDPLAFKADTEVLDAVHKLLEHRLSGAPVIDDTGKVVGFLSEKDCLKAALNASYYEERGGPVSQFMSRNIKTITASSPLTDVIELFLTNPYRCYPVVAEGRLIGQLSRRDALRALEKLW